MKEKEQEKSKNISKVGISKFGFPTQEPKPEMINLMQNRNSFKV